MKIGDVFEYVSDSGHTAAWRGAWWRVVQIEGMILVVEPANDRARDVWPSFYTGGGVAYLCSENDPHIQMRRFNTLFDVES